MRRLCLVCGVPTDGPRCERHGGDRRALTTRQRGYGAEDRRRRAQLLPLAIGQPCVLCGDLMRVDEPLDLDHTIPARFGGVGDRIVHSRCNRGRASATPVGGGSTASRKKRTGDPDPPSHESLPKS